MKYLLALFLVLVSMWSCSDKLTEQQSKELWAAYRSHNYFRLNTLVSKVETKSTIPELLVFKAKLGYIFNKPAESDSLIEILLSKYRKNFNDTVIADLYYMKAVNEDRLQNYKRSWETGSYIIEHYKNIYDSAKMLEFSDDNLIRSALIGSPRMEIVREHEVSLPMSKDIAGLMNIPVRVKSDTLNFVFDTGANLSCIVTSLANKYGFTMLDKKVYVLGFTGKRIEVGLAIGDLNLGSVIIKNSPFLVIPDSVFSFANGAYVIRGIIGFPIMQALGELVFSENKTLTIPNEAKKTSEVNFALDEATPVILVGYQNDSIPLHFDTGADRTVLYNTFYDKYKKEIMQKGRKKSSQVGGAGGTVTFDAYVMPKVELTAGYQKLILDSLDVLTTPITKEENYYYGNFGQDFISKYKNMRINFAYMNISFSNN